mmetsp:Transcript_63884/g.75634  ORF Transcript_63884/g.75634 Transcript_63884/m.75634 type:complete len:94 (-) Transcript_63884:436-717(-)
MFRRLSLLDDGGGVLSMPKRSASDVFRDDVADVCCDAGGAGSASLKTLKKLSSVDGLGAGETERGCEDADDAVEVWVSKMSCAGAAEDSVPEL